MSQIVVKPVADALIGDQIIDAGGRTLVRINDDALPEEIASRGAVALCDLSGNLIAIDGKVVATVVELDWCDPVTGGDGLDVLLRGWQGSVN